MKKNVFAYCIGLLLTYLPAICQNYKTPVKTKLREEKLAQLQVKYEDIPLEDTLLVFYFTDEIDERKLSGIDNSIAKGVYKDGNYYFTIPIKKSFTYFKLMGKRSNESDANTNSGYYHIAGYNYLVPGDSVAVVVSFKENQKKPKELKGRKLPEEFLLQFEGRGAEKCRTKYYLDSLILPPSRVISDDIESKYFTEKDEKTGRILDTIKHASNSNNKQIYDRLRADVYFTLAQSSLGYRRSYYQSVKNKKTATNTDIGSKYRKTIMQYFTDSKFQNGFSKDFLCNTISYIPFLYKHAEALAYLNAEENGGPADFFELLINLSSGEIRDRLLIYYFKNTYTFENFKLKIQKALKIAETDLAREYLKSLWSFVEGKNPYNFTLQDQNGKMIQLNHFAGKVVFIDFWFTNCISCANYFNQTLSKVEEQYKNDTNVVFISISADVSKETWIKSVKSGKYTSLHAVNLYTGGEGFLNKVIKEYNVYGFPLPILIDKKGIIKEYATPVLRDKELLIQRIKSLL